MNRAEKSAKDFIGYDYKELNVNTEQVSMFLDGYESFGWMVDTNTFFTDGIHQKAVNLSRGAVGGVVPSFKSGIHQTTIRLKRDRKIINKMELTRLQRHFEACANEIEALEKSKTASATVWALIVGIFGTAFMAGSVFAVTHEPPIIWLCILLAIPAFIGWILPYFLYRSVARKKAQKLQRLIEQKRDELYEICQKGYALL